MKNFTIENETNNITVQASAKEAEAVPNSERFSNEAALAKLAANWPAARLVEMWNSLPGETPVKKFKDRATAVSRSWKAIQSLGQAAPVVEEPAPVPETASGAELFEEAPVPEQKASETAQPEAVIPESHRTRRCCPFALHAPDAAHQEPGAEKKASRAKKAPVSATSAGAPRGRDAKTSQVIAMLKREGGATLEEIMTAMGW
jgi:hypothetical protein